MPDSIVARTTLAILALSLLLGAIFALAISIRVQKNEEDRLYVRLQELLSTVESTARVTCYLSDRTLAKEIALGLLSNRAVAGIRIVAGDTTLYETPGAVRAATGDSGMRVISRRINSPFVPTERVGEITLYASQAEMRAQARRYGWNMAVVLGLQVAFVAAGVAVVVFMLITRPIRSISNDLHRLEVRSGMRLRVPRTNRSDEIGRLVADVNALICGLTTLLDREHELRIEHQVQERKMKLIFDKAETGIFVLDSNGIVQSWNPAFVRILGLDERMTVAAAPQRLCDLLAPHERHIGDLIQRCLTTGQPCDTDLEITRRGALRSEWIELSINPIGPEGLQGVINDITERKWMEVSARRLASHDALTGLLNRQGVENSLAELFGRSTAARLSQVALLQIDLDYFKEVNDTYGHEAGDRVLCQVARSLESSVRLSDFVGRYGGDEFVAVLVGVHDPAKAQQIANNMIAAIGQPIDIGAGNCAHVSASIGIAFPSEPGETPDAVMRRADAAMYEAKRMGRSRACLASLPASSQSNRVATVEGSST